MSALLEEDVFGFPLEAGSTTKVSRVAAVKARPLIGYTALTISTRFVGASGAPSSSQTSTLKEGLVGYVWLCENISQACSSKIRLCPRAPP